MGAAGPSYEYDQNTTVFAKTNTATDHSQILMLKAEWREIKKCSSEIKIENPSFDWFSLFLGATFSTAIPLIYSMYIYFNSENKSLNDIVFYLIVTVFLLLFCLGTQSTEKKKKSTDQISCNKIHHKNLILKIDEIDERVKNEL